MKILNTTQGMVLLCAMAVSVSAYAGWRDWLKPLEDAVGPETTESVAGLSQQEVASGLKEALDVGIQRAIELLGREGGFLNDPQVKIPLPDTLQQVEKGLRAVGQDQLADEFVTTMNRAAERAVPETLNIFGDAIRNMTLEDAKAILNGPDDAATGYLRKNGEGRLQQAILPIVKEATESTGVTSAYKQMMGSVGGFLGGFLDQDSLDIDQYVTTKAMDGLFLKLADEEKRIREDPVARSTELLKTVFGR